MAERYPRETFKIAAKMPHRLVKSKEEAQRIFIEQIAVCGVDYFDVYLLHNIHQMSWQDLCDWNGFSFLREKKEQGKASRIGFSFHGNAKLLEEILDKHLDIDIVQLQINYLDWENEVIQAKTCYEMAEKYEKRVIVMEPLKAGALVNIPDEANEELKGRGIAASPASIALRFAASLKNVDMVLSGLSDIGQVRENIEILRDHASLTGQEKEVLPILKDLILKSIAIPCTACHYCTGGGVLRIF